MSTLLILLVLAAAVVVALIVTTGRKAEKKVENDLSGQDAPSGRGDAPGAAAPTPYMDQNQFAEPEPAGRDDGLPPASENPGTGIPEDDKPASDADKV